MIRSGYKWNGPAVAKSLQDAAFIGLRAAAMQAQAYIVRAISKPSRVGGGGRRRPGYGRSASGRKRSRGKPIQYSRSRPGRPPKRDTGKLAQSIFSSWDKGSLKATVGTTMKYGVALERGATIPPRRPVRKKVLVFAVGDKWVYTRYAAGFRLQKRPYIWSTVKAHKSKLAALQWRPIRDYLARGK